MNETIDKVLPLLKDLATQLNNLFTEYAPQAWEATLWVIRLGGLQYLLWGTVALILFISFLVFSKKILFPWRNRQSDYDREGCTALIVTLFIIVILVILSIMLKTIFNIWMWVQIFAPELFLAKELINKVLS